MTNSRVPWKARFSFRWSGPLNFVVICGVFGLIVHFAPFAYRVERATMGKLKRISLCWLPWSLREGEPFRALNLIYRWSHEVRIG